MADILRVTSPVINKNIIQPDRAQKDPSVPFDMQEIRHITKNPPGSSLLSQHNVFQKEAGAATLMNLLKDPSVTVNYLKNIDMLEEIINLLPVNNNTMTQEIRQLFNALLISPENIVDEMIDQEFASTLFKGPLFDFLRELYYEKPELRYEMADFLKAVNGAISKQDVLDSVANSLEYLAEQLAGSRTLAAEFAGLAERVRALLGQLQGMKDGEEGAGAGSENRGGGAGSGIENGRGSGDGSVTGPANGTETGRALSGGLAAGRMPGSGGGPGGENGMAGGRFGINGGEVFGTASEESFEALKPEIQAALSELENSVLYTPQTSRVIPNILYNMSRYQDNESYLQEALLGLLIHVNSREDKDTLRSLVRDYITAFQAPEHAENRSRIMDTLAEIISKQDRETPINSLNGEKIEKIITSLLSSPCNYTPLLHFVIPVDYHGMKAFSELWIDPKSEESAGGRQEAGDHIHVLITFDIPGVGQMEAEFKLAGREMWFYLYCPKSYTSMFEKLGPEFRRIMEDHGFHAAEVGVDELDHIRSLMDVFKNLPYRRTGVDVKI